MELIVILLGELLFAPFIAAMILVLELVALAIGGILDLIGSRIATDRSPTELKMPRRWSRILVWAAGGLILVTLATVLVLDLFCFTGTTRWILDRVERTTGSKITYDQASGSLFGGRLRLENLTIKKTEGPRVRCDLELRSAELRLSIWTLLNDTIYIDSLDLKEVQGSFTRLEAGPMHTGHRSTKAFEIEKLAIQDLDLQVTDKTKGEEDQKSYRLAVKSWQSQPLRSRWLPFDILFRTNCAGVIADSGFEIRSELIEDGRETHWKASNLPGWYLAHELSGPFALIKEGKVDVQVDDRWTHGKVTGIDSHWRLVLHGVRAEVPSGLPIKDKLLCKSWVAILNKVDKAPLEFGLTFDGSGLTTYGSQESQAVWAQVGVAMIKKLLGVRRK